MAHPYRTAASRPASRISSERTSSDGLAVVVGLHWALSLARVVGAFVRGEVFGAEATIALAVAVVVPAVLARRAISSLGRWRSRRG